MKTKTEIMICSSIAMKNEIIVTMNDEFKQTKLDIKKIKSDCY